MRGNKQTLSYHSSNVENMDNFGYREATSRTPTQNKRFFRNSSVRNDPESVPLNNRRRPQNIDLLEKSQNGREYLFVGPSPPAEDAPNMYHFDDIEVDPEARPTDDTLRQSLYERANSLRFARLLDDIECGNITLKNVDEIFANVNDETIINNCFLWSVFMGRDELLAPFMSYGADIKYSDQNGFSALHYSAFKNSTTSAAFLISQAADVDYCVRYFTPLHCAAFGNSVEVAELLIANNASLAAVTQRPGHEENLLHCAVRADADECLELFLQHGVDPSYTTAHGLNSLHLSAALGSSRCLAVLLRVTKINPMAATAVRDKETTALHLAAAGGHSECLELLLAEDVNANSPNFRGFTALHLASRTSSLECVEALLRDGNANPNAEDYDKRTPLHAAVSRSERACDIIEILISWGAEVNKRDEYGYTPLHLAALDSLYQCVETLIYHGADVTTKSKKGNSALNVIARKTPKSLRMITHSFDIAITLHQSTDINEEVQLEFDFGRLLKHSYPREITYLNNLVDEGQKEFLEHPLCSAFLYMKWEKIRKYYVARLVFFSIFVLFLTIYVLSALANICSSPSSFKYGVHNELCQKTSIFGGILKHNPFDYEKPLLIAITVFEVFRKLFGVTGYSNWKDYLTSFENLMEWFVLLSVFTFVDPQSDYNWKNVVGGFSVLCAWCNLMLMMGQLPMFGDYVAMYQRVQSEFIKLLLAYSTVLLGFTMSFCVIFPNEESFSNPFMGFITVLSMMVGELNLNILLNDPTQLEDPPLFTEISAQITFILFLIFVTLILMNLLVGIAVHDIQGLRKTAGLSKLIRQTKLILFVELGLFTGILPKCFRKIIYKTALVSPGAGKVVLSVKPLNPSEKRLPRNIMMAAYEIAQNNLMKTPHSAKDFLQNKRSSQKFDLNKTDHLSVVLTDMQKKMDMTSFHVQKIDQEIRDLKDLFVTQQNLLVRLLNAQEYYEEYEPRAQ